MIPNQLAAYNQASEYENKEQILIDDMVNKSIIILPFAEQNVQG
jgi:phosphoribosylpyrophosphate synthetase